MKKGIIIFLIFTFIVGNFVGATSLKGTTYGPSLNILTNTLIEIESDSKQSYVSKNGEYEFNLDSGDYIIEAKYYLEGLLFYSSEENLTINGENELIFDLILFPSDQEKFFEDYPEFDDSTFQQEEDNQTYLIILIIFLASSIIYFKRNYLKKLLKKSEVPKDLKEVIEIIQKNGRRINQKDLRNKLPYSEAKTSLIIADLESRRIIKKIKRGRGNILFLKD